jgi:hypothetical protein
VRSSCFFCVVVVFSRFLNEDVTTQTDIWWKEMDLNKTLTDQIKMEIAQKVKIQSINKPNEIDEKLVRCHFLSLKNF